MPKCLHRYKTMRIIEFASMEKSQTKPNLYLLLVLVGISLGDSKHRNGIDLTGLGDEMFGSPDEKTTGALVAAYNKNSKQNPEELGTYLEGDILVPLSYKYSRNGILEMSSRWPRGVVPYEIEGSFSTHDLDQINQVFAEYHKRTCVQFKPRAKEEDYIAIVSRMSGCSSPIGRIGGRQEVNLQLPGCLRRIGTAIHEVMHSLGFFHEQNRHERDSYVKLLSENVRPGRMKNFLKYNSSQETGFGVEYDYASVMHYSPKSFSFNGQPTLKAVHNTPEARIMGQRVGFSPSDVRKINAMYQCKLFRKCKVFGKHHAHKHCKTLWLHVSNHK
ncbi:hatching enzyme 1.2-like isoform X2 [Drosophila takahashii]|uniref:hatching enzyme 1.2-like isoform X2 n=1 Tax=Drosophila takahashii TaxID=29030 RepID=UPI003899226B